jgi:hypothetical protein
MTSRRRSDEGCLLGPAIGRSHVQHT